jgi:type 1 glutamine amidotransferase
VLVFSKTAGFRHDSIEAGVEALSEIGDESGFSVTATEDSEIFTSAGLAAFQVVVFLNTTGDVLDDAQQEALEAFIGAGKGFVGVHSAADTEYDWPWYGGLVAAYFDRHPEPQTAVVDVVAPEHPATRGLPARFERFDEWYDYRAVLPSNVTILATVDESSYEGGAMGEPHPIMWAHDYEGGRAVYTGFGHTVESFAEPVMRALLANAVLWAAGLPG